MTRWTTYAALTLAALALAAPAGAGPAVRAETGSPQIEGVLAERAQAGAALSAQVERARARHEHASALLARGRAMNEALAPSQPAAVSAGSGFDWGAAASGAGATLALVLGGLATVFLMRSQQRRSHGRKGAVVKTTSNLSLFFGLALLVAVSVALLPSVASADKAGGHDHATHAAADTLQDELAQIRRATARFHRVEKAIAAGYELGWVNGSGVRIITGCVSHPTAGAMGYHYFNQALVDDLGVDPLKPEALVYERARNGRLKLVAVEWVVPGPNTNPPGLPTAPSVLGMPMHILVPAVGFWLKHAWIWRHNPAGMFADWNPKVSCP